MKKLLTVRCLDGNREVIKTIAKMDKVHNLSAPVDTLVIGPIVKRNLTDDLLRDNENLMALVVKKLEDSVAYWKSIGDDVKIGYWRAK